MSGNLNTMLARGPGVVAPIQVNVIQTAGASFVSVPALANYYTAEAIAGGGNGFGNATTGNRAGGGGGQYAISNAKIGVIIGGEVYYSVGAAGADSWANGSTNAVPTLASTGCRARGGTNAASATAGVGNTAGGVGATIRNGGNGAVGNNSAGGGGAGATTAGSAATGGTDTTGLSSPTMAGGNGGGTGAAGTVPGGGGGNSTTTGTNPAGAIGRVRIAFYA